MPSLWFCVPVYGRLPLARICLRQLRRTCDSLSENGIQATAVVVADRDDLEGLGDLLGFGWVERDNQYVSRRFNDAIQMACDPAVNLRPADYVVPCGSDDWVDWRLFLDLPDHRTMYGFQHISFVREDGREMVERFLDYTGGSGIRIYPRQLMEPLGYRPADEYRGRGCDTSMITELRRVHENALRVVHVPSDPRQIVDWKTAGAQLNDYNDVKARHHKGRVVADPFAELADIYPVGALEEMQAHYGLVAAVAA